MKAANMKVSDEEVGGVTPSPRKRAGSAKKARKKVLQTEDDDSSFEEIKVEQFEFERGDDIFNSIVQEEKTPTASKQPSVNMSQHSGPRV